MPIETPDQLDARHLAHLRELAAFAMDLARDSHCAAKEQLGAPITNNEIDRAKTFVAMAAEARACIEHERRIAAPDRPLTSRIPNAAPPRPLPPVPPAPPFTAPGAQPPHPALLGHDARHDRRATELSARARN